MPFGPVYVDVGPGTSFGFGISPAMLPSWASGLDLSTVTGGSFRLYLNQQGSPINWVAYIGGAPAWQVQSSTFLVLVHDFTGTDFGGVTGQWWVSPTLNLPANKTVEVTSDYLIVTQPSGKA